MPLVTATFTTGGSVVITDTVEVTAISALSTAITANTVAINTTMGVIGSKTPGNVSTSLARQTVMQANMLKALNKIEGNQQLTIAALNSISASMEANTKAIAAVASSTQNIDIMATTATADQIKNNRFQQKVTNQALVDAGKPPVTVPAEEMDQVLTQTLADMKQMTTIQFAYKAVEKAQEMLTNSAKWTLQWAAETKIGKVFVDAYTDAKKAVLGLFGKDNAEKEVREAKAIVAEAESGVA